MAKTLFEILRKQTEIANRLEAATRKVSLKYPLCSFRKFLVGIQKFLL